MLSKKMYAIEINSSLRIPSFLFGCLTLHVHCQSVPRVDSQSRSSVISQPAITLNDIFDHSSTLAEKRISGRSELSLVTCSHIVEKHLHGRRHAQCASEEQQC